MAATISTAAFAAARSLNARGASYEDAQEAAAFAVDAGRLHPDDVTSFMAVALYGQS